MSTSCIFKAPLETSLFKITQQLRSKCWKQTFFRASNTSRDLITRMTQKDSAEPGQEFKVLFLIRFGVHNITL